MKKLFFVLGLIFMTMLINAQQTQSYSGQKSYATEGGYVGGEEQYTYLVDERGKAIFHGKYSYSGVNHVETNTDKIDAKYSISLNCKNGYLDGNIAIGGNYKIQSYKWMEGWKTAVASTKLSGIFEGGKPNGLFTISYKDGMDGAASVTLKNGKYVGTYSFQGYVDKMSGSYDLQYWYIMKGQLTEDGQLTGKWVYDTQVDTYNFTFLNDVLISETHKMYSTPLRIQEIAKKYANKQITKDDVLAHGYFIVEEGLPLNYVITQYILNEEFNISKIGCKYDFSDYAGPKKYTKIIELNTLTQPGFELLKESLYKKDQYGRISTAYDVVDNDGYVNRLCNFATNYDEQYDAYFLWCDKTFTERYGTKVTGIGYQDKKIYLTSSQLREWINLLENRALSNIVDFKYIFGIRTFRESYGYSDGLSEAYEKYLSKTFNDWIYAADNSKLTYLQQDLVELINDIETQEIEKKYFRLSKDKQYIISTRDNEYFYAYAFTNSIDTLKEMLNYVNEVCELYNEYKLREEFIYKKLDSITGYHTWYYAAQGGHENILIKQQHQNIVFGIVTSLDSINLLNAKVAPLLSSYEKVEKIYQQKVKDAKITSYDLESWEALQKKYDILKNIFKDIVITKEYICLRDSLKTRNEVVMAKLPASAQKKYETIYNTCQDISYYNEQTFTTKFAELIDAQNGYLRWSEVFVIAQNKDILIKEKILSHKDLTKVFGSMYKFNTSPTILNHLEAEAACSEVDSIIQLQDRMLEYIENRNIANQLHLEITELCAAYKGCAKADKILCKSYPLIWNAEKDNYSYITEVISILQDTKNTLQNQEIILEVDKQIKKAKTLDDIKTLLRITK